MNALRQIRVLIPSEKFARTMTPTELIRILTEIDRIARDELAKTLNQETQKWTHSKP